MMKIAYRSGKKYILRQVASYSAALCAAGLMFFSCQNDDEGVTPLRDNNVMMTFPGMTRAATDNTQVYVFNGIAGTARGTFVRQIHQISRGTNELTMTVPEGMWDITLVATPDGNGMDKIIAPTTGQAPGSEKMFELTPSSGVLPDAPMLLTAEVDDQIITALAPQTAYTEFARNVAMVKVVLKDPRGLSTTGTHSVSIGNIPTTLNWNGELMPNKNSPHVSSTRMTRSLSITEVNGQPRCDTVIFIVPAHRGSDFRFPNPTDTTTNRLDVTVNLTTSGGGTYSRNIPVPIPIVPKANRILVVSLLTDGELRVESDILPWETETFNYDNGMGNHDNTIQVSKAATSFPVRDTILLSGSTTANTTYSITSGAEWLTTSLITGSPNKLILNARIDDFRYARETYVDIKLDNMTKRIYVQQKSDGPGSISASSSHIYLSPVHPTASITAQSLTSFQTWTALDTYLATTNVLTNATWVPQYITNNPVFVSAVNFNRKTFTGVDTGDYSMFGEDTLLLRNNSTLEFVPIVVSNIFMRAEDIGMACPKVQADTTLIFDIVEVYGGSGNFTITENIPWLTATRLPDGRISITALKEPDGIEWQSGTIRVYNADDPSYWIDIPVEPSLIPTIEPFSFFTVSYAWAYRALTYSNGTFGNKTGDVDISFYFHDDAIPANQRPAFYDKYLGLTGSRQVHIDGSTSSSTVPILIEWGGDGASAMTREEVFFNAPIIENDNTLPRKLRMEVRAGWWSGATGGYYRYGPYAGTAAGTARQPALVKVSAFRGGSMQHATGTDNGFVHVPDPTDPTSGPVNMGSEGFQRYCYLSTGWVSSTGTGRMCVIIYDRKLRTAKIEWEATEETNTIMRASITGPGTGIGTRSAAMTGNAVEALEFKKSVEAAEAAKAEQLKKDAAAAGNNH